MITQPFSVSKVNAPRHFSGRIHGLIALLFALFIAFAPAEAIAAGDGHHGLTQDAPVLFDGGFFMINNSMVATWIVAGFLILGARAATKNIKEVPEGAQNFWEWLVESLYNFLAELMGNDLTKKTFWFFATVFIFILTANWFGMFPGVGTVGYGHTHAESGEFLLSAPLLRGANADFNLTFGMSMVFFGLWVYWALKANGPGGFLLHIFGPKGGTTGLMKLLMIVVFICVGLLEVVTILFRPITLSFRLFGNVFAGENLLETMTHMGGAAFGWLVPIPFYFLELLVGIVQALVFMLLTAVFTLLICSHDEEEAH